MTSKKAVIVIGVVWLTSGAIAFPAIAWWRHVEEVAPTIRTSPTVESPTTIEVTSMGDEIETEVVTNLVSSGEAMTEAVTNLASSKVEMTEVVTTFMTNKSRLAPNGTMEELDGGIAEEMMTTMTMMTTMAVNNGTTNDFVCVFTDDLGYRQVSPVFYLPGNTLMILSN